MSDRFDDKADMSVRGKLGSQAGSQKRESGAVVVDRGSVCKSCGARFAPGTAPDGKTDCPMC